MPFWKFYDLAIVFSRISWSLASAFCGRFFRYFRVPLAQFLFPMKEPSWIYFLVIFYFILFFFWISRPFKWSDFSHTHTLVRDFVFLFSVGLLFCYDIYSSLTIKKLIQRLIKWIWYLDTIVGCVSYYDARIFRILCRVWPPVQSFHFLPLLYKRK
jgi:hypothetical protein